MQRLNHFKCLFAILILWFGEVSSSSGWKPIIPPADYYATMPTTCVSDCVEHKYPGKGSDAVAVQKVAETDVRIAEDPWPNQSSPGGSPLEDSSKTSDSSDGKAEDSLGSGQNLNFVHKPMDVVSFTAPDIERRKPARLSVPPYQSLYSHNPIALYNIKTIIPKPPSTFFFGSSKLSKNFKFMPSTTVHDSGDNINVFIQPDDDDDHLKPYSAPLSELYKFDEHCTIYKVSFQQNLYYQYIQYKTQMPDLKEFTICLWFKLHNHSHSHPIFSYSTKPHHKDIYMWVSNLENPSLLYMKVLEQTIFRLNYPLKLFLWYHTCQSWNGYTGEWQVWLNGHRIARGFHNLLVGHKIPGKGIIISGQEYQNSGKNLDDTSYYYDEPKGLQGEITMLQMYKVALTAGKANNDHRHHHSHHTSTTPEPSEESSEEMSTTTEHPLLENGQLKTHVNILELVKTLKKKGHIEGLDHHHDQSDYHHHGDFKALPQPLSFSYHDPVTSYVLLGNNIKYPSVSNHFGTSDHNIFKRENNNSTSNFHKRKEEEKPKKNDSQYPLNKRTSVVQQDEHVKTKALDGSSHPENVQKIKFPLESVENEKFHSSENTSNTSEEEESTSEEDKISSKEHREGRARRHNLHSTFVLTSHTKPRIRTMGPKISPKKRPTEVKTVLKKMFEEKKKEPFKRFLVLADPYSNIGTFNVLGHSQYSSIPNYGHHGYDSLPHFGKEEDGDDHEHTPFSTEDVTGSGESPTQHELAEDEVKKIMTMCSGCHVDPFRKVAIISWRHTPKKIYSGALLLKANSECEHF